VRFRILHRAVYSGLAVNYLLSHAGEFLRAALVAREYRVPFSAVLASVIVERVLDFMALLLLIAILVILVPDLPDMVQVAAAIVAATVLIASVGLYLVVDAPDWLIRLGTLISRPLPEKVTQWGKYQIQKSRLGLAAIKEWRVMVRALSLSVLQWSFIVAAIWCSAVSVQAEVSVLTASVTFLLIVVGLMLPNSPMQLGTTQIAFVIGFGIDGNLATNALAASVIYTVFLILPVMLIGGVCLMRGRASWRATIS
jgi:uncharacterized protein (TIRG00374 family)